MEWERVCGVNGVGGAGSGYLVAPRLVLTSGHVVERVGASATVFRPGRAGSYTGIVLWSGTPGGRDDAALVRVDDDSWPPVDADVTWGRTVTHRPGIACTCWGVPDLVQRAGQPIDVAQLSGHLNPGDRKVVDRCVMHLDEHPPSGETPWRGMSGAAVFCGDLLVGVVAVDPAGRSHAALEAVPVHVLLRDPAFRELVPGRLAGVEVHELDDPHARRSVAVASPAGLLVASSAVVPFLGRTEELDWLHEWSSRTGPGLWLLHGPGGQGKTRLAQQFGARLAAEGWEVVWLRPGASVDRLADVEVPLLVVVDYAEGRVEQVAALLGQLGGAKVLLLARTAGEWWQQVAGAHAAAADLVDVASVHQLPTLDPAADLYGLAVTAFAEALPQVPGMAGTDWPLVASRLRARVPGDDETVLAVHTTALADLLDAVSTQDSGSRRGPEDRLLDHERRHWQSTARAQGLLPGLTMATLTDAVAAAVLLGAPGRREAQEFLARVPGLADQPRDRRDAVRAWLAGLYPSADRAFDVLQPDRLAERLIGRLVADDGRVSIVEELAPHVSFAEAMSLLVVCTRASRHAGVGEAVAQSLVQWCTEHADTLAAPALAVVTQVESPEPLLAAIERVVIDEDTDPQLLRNLGNALPDHTVVLAEVALSIATRMVGIYRQAGAGEALAAGLGGLSDRLGESGRPEEALATATESLELFRELAAEHPDEPGLRDDLVLALRRVAMRSADLGRLTDALAAISGATDLTRDLAAQDPDTYEAEHALNLNNLSVVLADLRRYEDSMAPLAEAVTVYRRLAESAPGYQPALAMVLHNLANRLHQLDRPEAVAAATESVAIRRSLAEQNPDAYLPDLAIGLNTFGLVLQAAGRTEEALSATEEAVHLYRLLVAAGATAAHLNDLARSLLNLSLHLDGLARPDEAAAAAVEAIDIRRVLLDHVPNSIQFRADLARSLSRLGELLHAAGRFAGELPVVTESLQLRFSILLGEPGVHGDALFEAAEAYKTAAAELGLGDRAEAATRLLGRLAREFLEGTDNLEELQAALDALDLQGDR